MKTHGCYILYSMGQPDHVHREPNMFFHNMGLWDADMIQDQSNWILKSIKSVINLLNHQHVSHEVQVYKPVCKSLPNPKLYNYILISKL